MPADTGLREGLSDGVVVDVGLYVCPTSVGDVDVGAAEVGRCVGRDVGREVGLREGDCVGENTSFSDEGSAVEGRGVGSDAMAVPAVGCSVATGYDVGAEIKSVGEAEDKGRMVGDRVDVAAVGLAVVVVCVTATEGHCEGTPEGCSVDGLRDDGASDDGASVVGRAEGRMVGDRVDVAVVGLAVVVVSVTATEGHGEG